MKAKKSYGQHFLINESLADNIVIAAVERAAGLPILEVGPGKGVLTKRLISHGVDFKAAEADRDMIQYLIENLPDMEPRIMEGDFLKHDLSKVFDGEFLLFGNYPYNISSQIIFRALKYYDRIPAIIGMFQKEMADRIIATHGNKSYGAISVLTQVVYHGKTIFRVSPGSFSPPPKVNSSVIKLERNPILPEEVDFKTFRMVVKNSFGQRRKMIRNTLKSIVTDEKLFEHRFFTMRPEQLSVQEFIELTLMIQNQNT